MSTFKLSMLANSLKLVMSRLYTKEAEKIKKKTIEQLVFFELYQKFLK